MKKLLLHLDTDSRPSVFDAVVAYDGGADHLIQHAAVNPDALPGLVDGAIFTRAPKDKKNTAIFIGGTDMSSGEALLTAVKDRFFGDFRVSVMLDSNGSNTTAAACIAKLMTSVPIEGKKAVVLAGTGPVGRRACAMLAFAGAREVTLTSRSKQRAEEAAAAIESRFGTPINAVEAPTCEARARIINTAEIVIACGASGIVLLEEEHWKDSPATQALADANATPPLGLGGIDMLDRGIDRSGKIIWGAIGFGALKLALHRACIAKLFESNTEILDAEEIFSMARDLA